MLKSVLSTPDTLTHATINPSKTRIEDVSQILNPKSSIYAILEVPSYVCNVRPPLRATLARKLEDMVKFMDTHV